MSLQQKDIVTAYDLLAMLILSSVFNYTPLLRDKLPLDGFELLSEAENGCRFAKLARTGDGWLAAETDISAEYCDFVKKKHKSIIITSAEIKRSTSMVKDYISTVRDSLEFDRDHTYYFEGAPCFGNLSFDIMYEMFKDINYLGFPPEHPYVKQLIGLIRTRNDIFENDPASRKSFVFDEVHLRDMMETGYAYEHVEPFRPLSPTQRREYFSRLIDTARRRPDKLRIRFIKEGKLMFPFVYGPGRLLYMNYSDTPYFEGYSIMLKEKGIITIMDDLAEYIWHNFTLNEKESIDKLEKMMDMYIK